MKRKYILMGVAILSSVVAGAQDYNGQHCPKDTGRLHNIGR